MSIDSDTAHAATRALVAGCFLIAAVATAARRRFGLTLFYIVAAIETYLKWRYELVAIARGWLLGDHFTDVAKYALQIKVLVASGAVGIVILLLVLCHLRRRPAEAILTIGTMGVLATFAAETISYHYLDAVIYTVQGGVMRSGWMYAAGALTAAAGAWALKRR